MSEVRLKVRRLRVTSPRNSTCGSLPLAQLDFSEWWTDNSFGAHYLHVAGPNETFHRVRCRRTETPRLMFKDGALYWLVDERNANTPGTPTDSKSETP